MEFSITRVDLIAESLAQEIRESVSAAQYID
jgi:hypothetical protein